MGSIIETRTKIADIGFKILKCQKTRLRGRVPMGTSYPFSGVGVGS